MNFRNKTADRGATEFLILSFAAVFLYQVYLAVTFGSNAANNFVMTFAFLEQEFLQGQYYRVFTSMFLHGGIAHLASNSIIFYLAGKSLEKKIGSIKFVILFLASGVSGSLLTTVFLDLTVPAIGASGGVFGILAAASLLVPTSSYLENIPVLEKFSLPVIRVLFSIVIVGVYFVFQETVMASLQIYQLVDNNVGHVAHFGGILAGITFSYLGYPDETRHSMKFTIPLVGMLIALVALPKFTEIWFGILVILVFFLIFWRRERKKKVGEFGLS